MTNRIVRSKWRSPYPFYRPSSDGTRFTATRGNMYPTHHPLCGPIIQICDHQTTNIITSSPLSSFPFTFSTDPHARSSRHVHDSSTKKNSYPFPITCKFCCSALLNIITIFLSFSTDSHAKVLISTMLRFFHDSFMILS